MNILTQLKQWPPTSTTVIGLGVLIGLVCYLMTGSIEGAIAVMGAFKIICPEDAGAVDQAIKIDENMAQGKGP